MSDNNVYIFQIKTKKEEDNADYFEESIRRNKENQKRLRKDRAKSNKSVLRSHRLKS